MSADQKTSQLPLDTAGTKLMNARMAAKRTLAEIAATTRIPERHLAALEQGRFADLPGRSYVLGFARSYAQAVGLEPDSIAAEMRSEIDAAPRAADVPAVTVFTPGDPNRLPSRRVAWIAGGGALAVALASLVVWRVAYSPAGSLPSLLPSPTPSASPASAPAAAPPAALAAGLPVVFTATAPGVWVKFYDQSGKQLMQKQMAQGETYTVPANAVGPMLWTARPDELAITIGGKPQPPLASKQMNMKDVPVSQAALMARAAPQPGVAQPGAIQPGAIQPGARPGAQPGAQPGARPGAMLSAAPGAAASAPHAAPVAAAAAHHAAPQPAPEHRHTHHTQPPATHDESTAPPPPVVGSAPAAPAAPPAAAPAPAANPSTVSH